MATDFEMFQKEEVRLLLNQGLSMRLKAACLLGQNVRKTPSPQSPARHRSHYCVPELSSKHHQYLREANHRAQGSFKTVKAHDSERRIQLSSTQRTPAVSKVVPDRNSGCKKQCWFCGEWQIRFLWLLWFLDRSVWPAKWFSM